MMASQYIDIDELNTLVINLNRAIDGETDEASTEAINAAGFALECYHQFDIHRFWPDNWNEALDGLSLEERQAGMKGLLGALFDLYNRPRYVCSSRVLRIIPCDFTARHATAPWVDDEDDELPW